MAECFHFSPTAEFLHDLRLSYILQRQGLSLNLLSQLVISLKNILLSLSNFWRPRIVMKLIIELGLLIALNIKESRLNNVIEQNSLTCGFVPS